jgi:hypothetical protein
MRICLVMITALFLIAAAEAMKPAVPKPEIVTRAQWGSDAKPLPDDQKHRPKWLTIHHAGAKWKAGADPAKFVKSVQAFGQREHNWPDLPYHFMIAPDGRIFEGRPIDYAPQSNTKYDVPGHVGIELMGDFEVERASEAQLKSLVQLSAWLCQEYKLNPEESAGHNDRPKAQTACPGKDLHRYLADGSIKNWVKDLLKGDAPDIKLKDPLKGGPKEMIGTVAATTKPAR